MNKKNLPYLIIAILIILCVVLLGLLFRKQPAYSPDILSVTKPVNTLQGVVQQIKGDTITVRQDTLTYLPGPTIAPEDQIVYTVHLTKDTTYSDQANRVFPLPASIPSLVNSLDKDQLEKDMPLQIEVSNDLRLTHSRDLVAQRVILPPSSRYVTGTITDIGTDTLQIQTVDKKNLTLHTNTNTDYYNVSDRKASDAKTINVNELKKNDHVVVFTNYPITSPKPLTLLRLVVIPQQSTIQPSPKVTIIPPGQAPPAAPQQDLTPLTPVTQINPEEYVAK